MKENKEYQEKKEQEKVVHEPTANITLNTGSTRLRTVIPSAPANLDIKNVSATT